VKSGVIRGVVSLEESSLVVFYYLVASEIWSDKRGGISRGEQRDHPSYQARFHMH
jgi:hypothetical protein